MSGTLKETVSIDFFIRSRHGDGRIMQSTRRMNGPSTGIGK